MQISEAESVVMEVLWAGSPRTAEEVIEVLSSTQHWQEPTIKTLLNRLLKKGAIEAERDGRRYLYTPLLAREDWVRAQSSSLLDRLFGGRLAPLVAQFQQDGGLSREDVAALRALLDQADRAEPTPKATTPRKR
jgi:BlaI family penicillinase repressor